MDISWTELAVPGCYAGILSAFGDRRGSFQKLFHAEAFATVLPDFTPRECYLTSSASGVLRGMHFQLPPDDHAKLVICLSGAALDVMVDLRPGSSYGHTAQVELSPDGPNCVAMPIGIGHGFYAHSDDTQLLYLVGTCHAPASDAGVLWSSIGFNWPDPTPILSERDKAHPTLAKFTPPDGWKSRK